MVQNYLTTTAGGWSTAHTGKPKRQTAGSSGGPSCGGQGWALTSPDVVPHVLRVRPVVYRRPRSPGFSPFHSNAQRLFCPAVRRLPRRGAPAENAAASTMSTSPNRGPPGRAAVRALVSLTGREIRATASNVQLLPRMFVEPPSPLSNRSATRRSQRFTSRRVNRRF